MRVLGICGSLQRRSSNQTLLLRAQELAETPLEIIIFDGLRELPLFNPDDDAEQVPAVQAWRDAIAAADALLIASPE